MTKGLRRPTSAERESEEAGPVTKPDRSGFTPLLWALSMRDGLTSTTKAVLIALASYANATGSCFPSVDRIADDARLSERTCRAAIAELETGGFITVSRNIGRGHSSVYHLNLKRSPRVRKGANAAPFIKGEKVQQVHHLKSQKVQITSIKGAAAAPQLTMELLKVVSGAKMRVSQRPTTPPNPRRCDPPECWHHLADRMPNGSPSTEIERIGQHDYVRPLVAGTYLDVAAGLVCDAAKITDPKWRGKWEYLAAWLREGISLHQTILPVIRKVAARSSYQPATSLAYFAQAIREANQVR